MTTSQHPHPPSPTVAEVEDMSLEQRARLAANLDDVDVVHNQHKWPLPGTRAEKRAERSVALWFAISALSGLAFLGAFLFWPYEYVPPSDPGYLMYSLYTPVVGSMFGLSVLAVGIGVIAYIKKFFPDEVSVQQRHDGASDDVARLTVAAQLVKAGQDTGIARRKMIIRTVGAASGVLGLGLGIAAVAPLVRNPWKGGDEAPLWVTGWKPVNGETVYLRRDTGDAHEVSLVRPEDQSPGSMETVFPFRESERDDEEALACGPASTSCTGKARRISTTATTTPSPRSAPTWAAPPRCTRRRPTGSSARATRRSSWPPSTAGRSSVRAPGRSPSYRLQ